MIGRRGLELLLPPSQAIPGSGRGVGILITYPVGSGVCKRFLLSAVRSVAESGGRVLVPSFAEPVEPLKELLEERSAWGESVRALHLNPVLTPPHEVYRAVVAESHEGLPQLVVALGAT